MLPWLKRNSGILSGALLLSALLGAGFIFLRQPGGDARPLEIHTPAPRPGRTATPAATAARTPTPTRTATPIATIMVQLDGAVQRPGIYVLREGARLMDALAAAGGLAADADGAGLNQTRFLKDGERIAIPRIGERGSGGTPAPGTRSTPAPAVPGKVNLNTASAAQLETLPGIGPALALSIVSYRDAHGPFEKIEDLEKISGIGPVLVARIRDLVVLR